MRRAAVEVLEALLENEKDFKDPLRKWLYDLTKQQRYNALPKVSMRPCLVRQKDACVRTCVCACVRVRVFFCPCVTVPLRVCVQLLSRLSPRDMPLQLFDLLHSSSDDNDDIKALQRR